VRAFRIRFSTNVERIALALGHKAREAEWGDVTPANRTPVVEASGQELVPVLVTEEGHVLTDSPRILRWIEATFPEPPLLPADPHDRAEIEVFCDWFNRVWKRPPNLIADGDGTPDLVAELEGSMDLFEGLLHSRDYLFGELSLADVTAFPFLKYALGLLEGDDEEFHRILHEHLPLSGRPRVAERIRRVDTHPRA